MKRFKFTLLLCLILFLCCASASASRVNMPFNGEITFHGIQLTVPENFIRDSTQSSDDFWVFERNWYSAVLLISRNSQPDASSMQDYSAFMESIGAEIASEPFLHTEAAVFTYYNEDTCCREIMFEYRGSIYAIALRGGDEAEFRSILDSVSSSHADANNARKNIRSGILKDILE